MDETLDSLQLVYRLLVTLSVAIFVLVLSFSNKPGPYQAAYNELKMLRNTMPKVSELRDAAVSNYYRESDLPKIIHEADPDLDLSNLKYEGEEENYQFMPPVFFAGDARPIDKYYQYLKMAPDWDNSTVHQFDHDDFVRAFRAFVEKYKLTSLHTLYIQVPKDEGHEYAIIQGKCGFATEGPRLESGDVPMIGSGENIIACQSKRIAFPGEALQLLKTTGLIQQEGDEYLALPSIRAVWDTAKGQDIQILTDILQTKAAAERRENENKLDLFGLSVQASTAVIVGPSALVLLLMFLLGLILHVGKIESNNSEKIRSFPWFGLWRNTPGALISFGSVVFAPLGAGLSLIYVAMSSGAARNITLLLFLTFASTIAAMIVIQSYRLTRTSPTTLGDARQEDRSSENQILAP